MRAAAGGLATVLLVAASPSATADTVAVDLPAGSVGQQVMALGRLARADIAVPDPRLWSRRVPALRGRLEIAAALAAIAGHAGARVDRLGPGSWRLIAARVRSPGPAPPGRPAPGRMRPDQPSPIPLPSADIVVTASKRDTARDQFAGQVVRIDGRDLELGGAGGTDRLAARLTTIASTHLGAGRNKLFIRGIADSSFTGPTQATVGQYYGDLRLSYNAPDPDLRLADLAAVEVLEGPQGTLYGAGSLGGLIRLVPNAPDPTRTSGSATLGGSATMHGAPGADAQAVVNLPVWRDRLAVRLVGTAAREGGYIDKPLLGRVDVNETHVTGGRATARLELGPGWSVELIGIGQRTRGADSQYTDRGGALTRTAPVSEGFRSDFGQAQFVVAGTLGTVRLRSTTGVTRHDLMERYDATAGADDLRVFAQANRTRMVANETRAWQSSRDGSGWLAGFSYIHNRTRLTRLFGAPDALVPTTGVVNAIAETTLYGEGSVRLLPGLLTTGGLRITRSVLDGEGEDAPDPAPPLALATTASRTGTMVLPAASALIDLTPGTKFFLRYQQGFRPGGLAIAGDSVRRFRNDRVATIEAGVRSGAPGANALDIAATVARTAWRDIQADFIDGSGLPSTANIGDGRIWTMEGVLGLRLAPGLRVDGAISYNDSRIDDPSQALAALSTGPVASPDATGAAIYARLGQIPNIARVTARGGMGYQGPVGRAADIRIDSWLRYVGSSRLGIGPILGQRQGGYLDSGITARLGLGAAGITVGVTNLADVRGNRFALGTPLATGREQMTPLRPRTLRLGLDATF